MEDDDVKARFGQRVRQLRTAAGVSQEAFAHRIGMDRSYYGSIERGERNVSLENICLIANGLGLPAYELLRFDRIEDPSVPSPRSGRAGSTSKRGKSTMSGNGGAE